MKIVQKSEYQRPAKRIGVASMTDEGCICDIEVVHTKSMNAAIKRVERLFVINTPDNYLLEHVA